MHERKDKMTKLKPCPFCSGEAYYDRDWRDVQCRVCNARVSNNFQSKREAIEAWNTRPNPWHTGTPSEEGWYLLCVKTVEDEIVYDTDIFENGEWRYETVYRKYLKWKKIEETGE